MATKTTTAQAPAAGRTCELELGVDVAEEHEVARAPAAGR